MGPGTSGTRERAWILISHVDQDGRLQHQELTLFDDHFVWVPGQGLKTGTVNPKEGSSAAHSSDLIKLDPEVSKQRLATAHDTLEAYTGQDNYVLHMRHVIEQATRGTQEHAAVVITLTRDVPATEVPVPKRPATPRPPMVSMAWIVAGAMVLAAALFLLVR
ncbi:MAG: hypothetical protein QM765_37720 [Myxococcales bacterium]